VRGAGETVERMRTTENTSRSSTTGHRRHSARGMLTPIDDERRDSRAELHRNEPAREIQQPGCTRTRGTSTTRRLVEGKQAERHARDHAGSVDCSSSQARKQADSLEPHRASTRRAMMGPCATSSVWSCGVLLASSRQGSPGTHASKSIQWCPHVPRTSIMSSLASCSPADLEPGRAAPGRCATLTPESTCRLGSEVRRPAKNLGECPAHVITAH
jgi:hypothetical protein